jgi:hypothetical protein
MVVFGSLLRILVAVHPLHTSLAQVTFDTHAKTVNVSLRVFVDDFTSAASIWAGRNPARVSAPVSGYAAASITLRDAGGKPVQLRSCGEKRVGELMWVCLSGQITTTPSGSRVVSRVLFERFEDQVNIVQTSYDGKKSNLLFTSDDTEKRIP